MSAFDHYALIRENLDKMMDGTDSLTVGLPASVVAIEFAKLLQLRLKEVQPKTLTVVQGGTDA